MKREPQLGDWYEDRDSRMKGRRVQVVGTVDLTGGAVGEPSYKRERRYICRDRSGRHTRMRAQTLQTRFTFLVGGFSGPAGEG